MKKNITINMFGQLYAIDEDAYELLKNYLDTIRQYFRKEEGGDEIADDIEGRIGELFSDLKRQGVQAITIDHVSDIIKRIGNPEDMDTEEEAAVAGDGGTAHGAMPSDAGQAQGQTGNAGAQNQAGGAQSPAGGKKKFYRDSKDKILAGVLSGASKYFGGDPLAWRLGFVLFVVLWNSASHWWLFRHMDIFPIFSLPLVLYILLAFLAPSAKTPEERLKMKGKNVNPQNLADEVALEAKEREDNARYGAQGSTSRGCLSGFFSILGVIAKIFIGLFCLGLFVAFVVTLVTLASLLVSPDSYMAGKMLSPEVVSIYSEHPVLFWFCGICLLHIFFIPGYCAFHSLLSSSGKTANMSMWQRWLWFLAWLVAIIGITLGGVSISKIATKRYVEQHTHDGVFFNDNDDWRFFQRNNFKVLGNSEYLHDDFNSSKYYFTSRGDYYGDDRKRYFSSWNYELLDYYQIEREDKELQPGVYRLSAVARTDDDGAFLYVVADSVKLLEPVPAFGHQGGGIFEEAKHQLAQNPADSLELLPIVTANDSLGNGWSQVSIDNIVVKGHSVRYGVSTVPEFTGMNTHCTFLDATDFKLERVR